ncbi:MAG TPA: GGDEF domain-containing protein [Noviherbaspirillum sp.]|nr:GGDEF domain-containing protein [Noviherbaspirillum sp.]
MSSTSNAFLVGALFCVLMLLVLSSLFRSGLPGIRELFLANLLGGIALVLYAFGREVPPLVGYEVANGLYAASAAAVLAGYRRFLGERVSWPLLIAGVGLVVAAIALFHYRIDSFALRTTTIAVFQSALCIAIIVSIFAARHRWRSRYPYYFAAAMAGLIAVAHITRSLVHLQRTDEITSLLQPSGWNLFFVSAGTFVLPVLTIALVMMVHDAMMARAEHAANRDFLTGAWSRRAFFELGERELSRGRRHARRLSLLLLDIDHFKAINDNWGHAAGDQVLIDTVARAGAVLRNGDFFARIGGEEFGVLLPETEGVEAERVAERLRAALDHTLIVHQGRRKTASVSCTVSIGFAVQGRGETLHDILRRADAALYEAKQAGRNRVVAAADGGR